MNLVSLGNVNQVHPIKFDQAFSKLRPMMIFNILYELNLLRPLKCYMSWVTVMNQFQLHILIQVINIMNLVCFFYQKLTFTNSFIQVIRYFELCLFDSI